MAEKNLKTFRLSAEALRLLSLLSEKQNRSPANMLEVLIIESAKKEKIK